MFNPFQSPLDYAGLQQIEELNPDIVLGIQDVKNDIDRLDDQVIKGMAQQVEPIHDTIDFLDRAVASECINTCVNAGNTLSDCDQHCKCVIDGICDDIGTQLDRCTMCEDVVPFTDEMFVKLPQYKTLTVHALFGKGILGNKKDAKGGNCGFKILLWYCTINLHGVLTKMSCKIFQIKYEGDVILVTNCQPDGQLLCTPAPMTDDLLSSYYLAALAQLDTTNVDCALSSYPIEPPTEPPLISPPYPEPEPEPEPPTYTPPITGECCPPSKTIVNVPPCPPINVTVTPTINIDQVVTQSQSQQQAQQQAQQQQITGPLIPGQTNESCPDDNDIEELITICGESRMMEFMEREQISPFVSNTKIGDYIRQRILYDQIKSSELIVRS